MTKIRVESSTPKRRLPSIKKQKGGRVKRGRLHPQKKKEEMRRGRKKRYGNAERKKLKKDRILDKNTPRRLAREKGTPM